MVLSYDRLDMKTLRDGADRVLRQNFPNSRFLREGLDKRDRSWWQFW